VEGAARPRICLSMNCDAFIASPDGGRLVGAALGGGEGAGDTAGGGEAGGIQVGQGDSDEPGPACRGMPVPDETEVS
jgi:hypothetical protein